MTMTTSAGGGSAIGQADRLPAAQVRLGADTARAAEGLRAQPLSAPCYEAAVACALRASSCATHAGRTRRGVWLRCLCAPSVTGLRVLRNRRVLAFQGFDVR